MVAKNVLAAWRKEQTASRSYLSEVARPFSRFNGDTIKVSKHGALSIDPDKYPLLRITVGDLSNGKPNLLITAGVHGYETGPVSAVHRFLQSDAQRLSSDFNFVVFPCISPWAYETNQRYNFDGLDTNRNFLRDGNRVAEECVAVMDHLRALDCRFAAAIDLHETTGAEEEHRFEQEMELLGGKKAPAEADPTPDGYYLYADSESTGENLGRAIINSVGAVTPICTDEDIYGDPHNEGILILPQGVQGSCMAYMLNHADRTITTEVCTPGLSMDERVEGQIASIKGAIEHLRAEP